MAKPNSAQFKSSMDRIKLRDNSLSTSNLHSRESFLSKSRENLLSLRKSAGNTQFKNKPFFLFHENKSKVGQELINSHVEEQARLIDFYKNRVDDLVRKTQQLEKFSNALIEQRAFKFFRIDPAKIRVECDIIDHWSANIAKTEFDILRSRIEEQTGLISYYKNRGDDYIKKILSIERNAHELGQKKQRLEADLSDFTEQANLKEQELNQTINGLIFECDTLKEKIEQMSAEHEKTVDDLNLVSQTNAEVNRKENERIQLSMSREIADLVDKLEEKVKEVNGLNEKLEAKSKEKKKLSDKVTELNQELALAELKDDQKLVEIREINEELKKAKNEIVYLKSGHYEKNIEVSKLNEQVSEKNDKVSELWAKLNQKDGELADRNKEINELSKQILEFKDVIEEKTNNIQSLNSKLNEKSVVVSELYSEIKSKNERIESLNSTICKKMSEYDELKQENNAKTKECLELDAKIGELDVLNMNLGKELNEKGVELSNLSSDFMQKSTQASVLSMEKREKSMEVNRLNSELNEKRKTIHNLTSEKEELDKKVKDLYIVVKNVKEEYEAKIGYFQRQIVELKNEKEGFSGIVKKQSSENINLLERNHNLNNKVKDLNEKLDNENIKSADYALVKSLEKRLEESAKNYDDLLEELIYYKTYVKKVNKDIKRI